MKISDLQYSIFIYPTDTTFGLGCSMLYKEGVETIYNLKQRPPHKPFILLVDTAVRLQDLVEVPDTAWQLIEVAEKPLTIVYDTPINVPEYLVSEEGTIAIRLTDNIICKKIIQGLKSPIVSTSVNISGMNTPTVFEEIPSHIIENVDYIFPECKEFVPHHNASSVIQVNSDETLKVLRT